MSDSYVSLNGHAVTRASVVIGYQGPWHAELHLPNSDVITNPCRLTIGSLTMVGSVQPDADGVYATQRKLRVVGGAGGWQKIIRARGFHNDAGVKALLVAQDTARDCGETLGTFEVERERLGADYLREERTASSVLTSVIGAAQWWVDYEGITHVGERPSTTPPSSKYTVLRYDPAERTATLDVDDPGAIQVGATISEGLETPAIVRELEITASGDGPLTVHAWLGEVPGAGRLATLLTTIARQATEGRMFGCYRYRVVQQDSDDRVHLQPVSSALGLPDLSNIPIWSVSGVRVRATLGVVVLVSFADGDRAQPVVVAFEPSNAPGWTPVSLTLGGLEGPAAARVGDSVALPVGTTFTATIGGVSTTCTVTAWGGDGTISSGSSVVKIA